MVNCACKAGKHHLHETEEIPLKADLMHAMVSHMVTMAHLAGYKIIAPLSLHPTAFIISTIIYEREWWVRIISKAIVSCDSSVISHTVYSCSYWVRLRELIPHGSSVQVSTEENHPREHGGWNIPHVPSHAHAHFTMTFYNKYLLSGRNYEK